MDFFAICPNVYIKEGKRETTGSNDHQAAEFPLDISENKATQRDVSCPVPYACARARRKELSGAEVAFPPRATRRNGTRSLVTGARFSAVAWCLPASEQRSSGAKEEERKSE